MLFLLFVYHLFQGASTDASPIPSFDSRSLAANRCNDLARCRTIWNIVWSCLVTIFSCTWVAIHPNIPCPKKRNPVISFAEHRLPLFICALLVPEYILAWAIRQFLTARKIANSNKGEFETFGYLSINNRHSNNSLLERGWSMTHGFFIIMGGFHLFEHDPRSKKKNNDDGSTVREDDKPLHPLKESDLWDCDRRYESFVMPTKAEIKDRGKSDWLAKSLVLLQTTWFVMQCIARGIEHLPVTHLEIVTLAYAAMNFVIYTFWWNKPLNVNRPVRVFRKSDLSETQPQVRESFPEARKLTWETIREGLETISDYIAGDQDRDVDLSREDRVPRFWADSADSDDVRTADGIVLGVGICFGAIHCIAWAFSSPTFPELLIWRISSVAITAVPIPMFFGTLLTIWLGNMVFVFISILPAGVVYIIARAVTLVLAFTSLRDLPPGAYDTVHWTTFIPHV